MKVYPMRKPFIYITLALALTACNSSDGYWDFAEGGEASAIPVGFEVYSGNVTRATYGPLDNQKLMASADGIGVFACYHLATETFGSSSTFNFMNNQQVRYLGQWAYAPIKYWPNEPDEHLSFFAYAPYVDAINATTVGFTSIGTQDGYPTVGWTVVEDPTKQVDLMWAAPCVDQPKPASAAAIQLQFRHALAKLNFFVDASGTNDAPIDPNTKIVVKSLQLTGNMALSGTLSLSSTTTEQPSWSTSSSQALVFSEGSSALNPMVTSNGNVGVTNTTVSLLKTSNDGTPGSIMVIPTTSSGDVGVTIVYDVKTTNGTTTHTVTNTITKTVSGVTIEAGKEYNFNLHLGLQNVAISATANSWTNANNDNNDISL